MQEFTKVRVERVRDYWDRRPCNVRHSAKPPGTKEYYDEVEARKYFVEPHIPRFAEFARWKDRDVLEVGCGIGTDTMNFARAGARVTAVDLSAESVAIASRRAQVYGLQDSIQFYTGNAEELAAFVPVRKYDLIYSFGVIHHTPHPDQVLAQLRSYANPSTTLKVMVYHRHSWKVAQILVSEGKGKVWDLQRLVARHSEAQLGSPVTYSYTRGEARRLLEVHGFEVKDVFVDHIFPYRVEDYREYRYIKLWYFQSMPKVLFRWLEGRFGWHLCLTARAN